MKSTSDVKDAPAYPPAPCYGFTAAPIEAPPNSHAQITPEFVRLPPPGELEPHTGLGRSFLNSLILPSAANNYRPPIHSISLRRPGHRFGVRLISFHSLMSWIWSHDGDGAVNAIVNFSSKNTSRPAGASGDHLAATQPANTSVRPSRRKKQTE